MNIIKSEILIPIILALFIATAVNLLGFRKRSGMFSVIVRVFGILLFLFLAFFLIILFKGISINKLLITCTIIIIIIFTIWFILKSLGYEQYKGIAVVVKKPIRKKIKSSHSRTGH
jgi:ABC-type transport system involved in cytochrome bd biosynthesis fused ATPase/permease subunit